MLSSVIRLLRLHQWVKNLLIFIPAFFAGNILDSSAINLILCFLSFSFVASSVYIVNDIVDSPLDKLHPRKRFRPIANGEISRNTALLFFGFCLLFGIGLSFLVSLNLTWVLLAYLVINLLYSWKLKQIVIIDLIILATGFLLRIYAGGIAASVPISNWLLLMIFLLAVFVGLAKRRDDLLLLEVSGITVRKGIQSYTKRHIDIGMVSISLIAVLSYIMYTISPEVVARIGNENLYWSASFVIVGIARYMHLTWVKQKSGSPIRILLGDPLLLLIILLWVLFFVFSIYI
jgi:4-hydroxybenzoate polyprenyltransferase